MNLEDIRNACYGRWLGISHDSDVMSQTISSVTIDSRMVEAGCLFVPLAGTKVDGHDFINDAFASGAICSLTQRDMTLSDFPLIKVDSTLSALMDIATAYRKSLKTVHVVAITGSAGKTTTKDMTASILSESFATHKTLGNQNTEIGMPLAILSAKSCTQAMVLEMGMRGPGQIRELSLAAQPDIAVFTNIGDAHIEKLGSREAILQAKLEMLEGMAQGAIIVYNHQDPMLANALSQYSQRYRVVPCGDKNAVGWARVWVEDILEMCLSGSMCRLCWQVASYPVMHLPDVHVALPGSHMIMNTMQAVAVGISLMVHPSSILAGIAGFLPSPNRMNIINANGMVVIDDTYNANPESMRACILAMPQDQGRRVCILGDMMELGDISAQRHMELGELAAAHDVEYLVCVGDQARHIWEGYTRAKNNQSRDAAAYFPHIDDFASHWQSCLNPGDVVLVKASRAMAFERIIEIITNEKGP